MATEQATIVAMQDVRGQYWRFELSLANDDGLRVFRDDQPLGAVTAQAIVHLAADREFAEDHAAAVLGELAGVMGCILPASIYEPFHAALSRWLWERAPLGG